MKYKYSQRATSRSQGGDAPRLFNSDFTSLSPSLQVCSIVLITNNLKLTTNEPAYVSLQLKFVHVFQDFPKLLTRLVSGLFLSVSARKDGVSGRSVQMS